MSVAVAESVPQSRIQEPVRSRIPERIQIFAGYCLQRESTGAFFRLVFPLVSLGCLISFQQLAGISVCNSSGATIFRQLMFPVAFFLCFNAAQHISSAISWEISLEMRDLVRLTDINPVALLWCRTLPRIWTTILSILMFLPVLAFARTCRGITGDQWLSAGSWLLLLLCLSTGFSMLAGAAVSKGQTSEATAASASFVLALVYHLLFWLPAGLIVMIGWVMNSMNYLPLSSPFWAASTAITNYSPVVLFYRNLYDPLGFSFFAPEFWVHFLTALVCVCLSVWIARNRFRVTSQGDSDDALIALKANKVVGRSNSIPRCNDRPFLWKDRYILGSTDKGGGWFWFGFSCLILHGVFTAAFYQLTFVATIATMILVPFMMSARFDALLAVEFREKTFDSLIILPVNPWTIIVSKVQAAFWNRRWLLMPLLVTSALSAAHSPKEVMTGAAIALLASVLLCEISIVNNLERKKWLTALVISTLFIAMLVVDILAFQRLTNTGGIVVSASLLIGGSLFCHWYSDRRLKNWTGD